MANMKGATKEIGVVADHTRVGLYNSEELLPLLRGDKAIKVYREMANNDAVIGAILMAMDMLLRGVEWRVEAVDDSEQAAVEKEFVETLIGDMSHTFEDFISDVLTMLPFGFSYFEIVMKRRDGPAAKVPSRYSDGRLGIRKLGHRPQNTLERWDIDDDGGLRGMIQRTPGGSVLIPIEKALLFRTRMDTPSGRSVLRTAYRSWYYAKHIQGIEAIAIERELNGLPVGRIPSEYLAANATASQQAVKSAIEQILRDVKKNEQGFVLLPSDMFEDSEGKPTNTRMVDIELLASNGRREIDPGAVILRYQRDIARTVLADFIMLGADAKGSFALSRDKTDLFLTSLEGYLSAIAAVLNRHLLPRVWAANGLSPDLMPTIVPGDVAPVDIGSIGEFVRNIAGAGATLFPDDALENTLRAKAGLPEADPDRDMLGRRLPGEGD